METGVIEGEGRREVERGKDGDMWRESSGRERERKRVWL